MKTKRKPKQKSEQATSEAFTGFSSKGIRFLEDLSQNNDKAWFDAHRDEYERHLREPARAFVRAIGPRLRRSSSTIQADPRVGGSIARINRDIRFTREKHPYKNHLALVFWEGEVRNESPSILYVRLRADGMALHVGNHKFSPGQLARYRDAVAEPRCAGVLTRILSSATARGYRVEGPKLLRVPRGFDEDVRTADVLRHGGLYLALEAKLPVELGSEAFVEFCYSHFKTLAPLHRWLLKTIGD